MFSHLRNYDVTFHNPRNTNYCTFVPLLVIGLNMLDFWICHIRVLMKCYLRFLNALFSPNCRQIEKKKSESIFLSFLWFVHCWLQLRKMNVVVVCCCCCTNNMPHTEFIVSSFIRFYPVKFRLFYWNIQYWLIFCSMDELIKKMKMKNGKFGQNFNEIKTTNYWHH